jgi:hypothetical protein
VQEIKGSGGRILASYKTLCESKVCPFCSMIRLLNEYEAIKKDWIKRYKRIYAVKIKVKDKYDYDTVHEACQKISRWKGTKKIRLLGFCPSEGTPEIWLFSNQPNVHHRGVTGLEVERMAFSAEEAVEKAMDVRLSWYNYGWDMVEIHRGDKLYHFLGWSSNRRSVTGPPAERKGVPTGDFCWPSQKAVRAAKQQEDSARELDAYEGEHLTNTLTALATGVVLGVKRKHFGDTGGTLQFSIDEAIGLARNNPEHQARLGLLASQRVFTGAPEVAFSAAA